MEYTNATLDGAVPAMIRAFTGDSLADMMEIPRTTLEWVIVQAFRLGRVVNKED